MVSAILLVGHILMTGFSDTSIIRPAGPVGEQNRLSLLNALSIMLIMVVPMMLATLAFAWWSRAGNSQARYRPDWAYSGRIEVIVWAIPIITILFLGGVIWVGSHQLYPARPLPSRKPALERFLTVLNHKGIPVAAVF